MPPRSSSDRDEHSLRGECSDASDTTDVKDEVRAPKENLLAAAEAEKPKSVRFAPTAKVRQFTKFSRDQGKDIWFVNGDFAKMKRSFAPTVQRMMNGTITPEDEEEHCIRGLEYRTKDGARRRTKNKFNGMAAVLHEQDRQIFGEAADDEQLARVYAEVNAHCRREAAELGAQDELDIQEYRASDNEPYCDAPEGQGRINRSLSGKRTGKLKHCGSFHERSIRGLNKGINRGLKRIFSGKKIRRPIGDGGVSALPA